VDACTVTALDAITVFTVPNPNCYSQIQSVFSGLAALQVALPSGSLSLLRIGNFLVSPTLSAVDVDELNLLLYSCQRNFCPQSRISVMFVWKTQAILDFTASACARTNSNP